jgi:hypothetical protein
MRSGKAASVSPKEDVSASPYWEMRLISTKSKLRLSRLNTRDPREHNYR